MIASLRGNYTIDEASSFMVALVDNDEIPRYEQFFANPRIRVHTVGILIDPPIDRPSYRKISYYIDHYSPVAYISEYEWNVARHDIHDFLDPNAKRRTTFGDLVPEEFPRQ